MVWPREICSVRSILSTLRINESLSNFQLIYWYVTVTCETKCSCSREIWKELVHVDVTCEESLSCDVTWNELWHVEGAGHVAVTSGTGHLAMSCERSLSWGRRSGAQLLSDPAPISGHGNNDNDDYDDRILNKGILYRISICAMKVIFLIFLCGVKILLLITTWGLSDIKPL